MEYIIITNNRKVFNFYKETDRVIFFEKSEVTDILNLAKDKINSGHKLLSDPIIATLENNDNPFKSIIVSKQFYGDNSKSQSLMEDSLLIFQKLPFANSSNKIGEKALELFRFIDLNLLNEGIKNIELDA